MDGTVDPRAPAALTIPTPATGAWLLMGVLAMALSAVGARDLLLGSGLLAGSPWGVGTRALGLGMVLGGVVLAVIARRPSGLRLVLDPTTETLLIEEAPGSVTLPLAALAGASLETLPVAQSPLALSLGRQDGGRVDLLVAGAEQAAEPFVASLGAAIATSAGTPLPSGPRPLPPAVTRHVSGPGASYSWSARPAPEQLAALVVLLGCWLMAWPQGQGSFGRLVGVGLLSAATLAVLGYLLVRARARHHLRIHAGVLSLAPAAWPTTSRGTTVPVADITRVDVTHHPAVGLGLVLHGSFAPSGVPISRGRLPLTALVALGLALAEQIDAEHRARDAPR